MKQQAAQVFMVEPTHFGFNSQTALSNAFQQEIALSPSQIKEQALAEFNQFVAKLRAVGIAVYPFKNSSSEPLPDAVFPNNWISLHRDGTLVLYPMLTPNRSAERDPKILDFLQENFAVKELVDFTSAKDDGKIVEGTGSIVFDHIHRIAYACLSQRTHLGLFKEICHKLDYQPIAFTARDKNEKEIYHTNVMMAIGEAYALICLDSIVDRTEREQVKNSLEKTGHEIISITHDQMSAFAGNALELINQNGERFLALSQTAYDALTPTQIETIEQTAQLLPIAIPTIERIGGGSVRCMLAEIFTPKRKT